MAKKKASKEKPNSDGSWKSIKQSGCHIAITPEAKKQCFRLFKLSGMASSSLCLIVGIIYGGYLLKNSVVRNPLSQFTQPINQLEFKTRGVLTEAWMRDVLDMPDQQGMLDVDIFELKMKLEQVGQVRSAIVEREFSNTLRISIEEHRPILKVIVMSPEGRRDGLLISEDGHIYKGQRAIPGVC